MDTRKMYDIVLHGMEWRLLGYIGNGRTLHLE
jgi:hypothetical protein